jgi:hypothetical protein
MFGQKKLAHLVGVHHTQKGRTACGRYVSYNLPTAPDDLPRCQLCNGVRPSLNPKEPTT